MQAVPEAPTDPPPGAGAGAGVTLAAALRRYSWRSARLQLALVVGQLVLGPGQGGLGGLELGGGRPELGLEGALAAAGVVQGRRLGGREAYSW